MEETELRPPANLALRCAGCGDVLGVYEPLVHLIDGMAHVTSLAAEPELGRTRPDTCYHADCAEPHGAAAVTVA